MRKNKIQKIVAFILCFAILFVFIGCNSANTNNDQNENGTEDKSQVSETVEPEPQLTPAYSIDDLQTVDEEGNRVTQGRDAVGNSAMAVSSKYEVSQVGSEIMEAGGNAIDAAVAMGFALGVVEPFSNGIGGGGLATIHTSEGEKVFIDFREVAPANVTLDMYIDDEGENNNNTVEGGLASAIPGEVAGMLYMLDNYGTMTREEVLAPAIKMAEEGFTITDFAATAITDAYGLAVDYPAMQKVYWNNQNLPYESGDVINNPDLAKTLKIIAQEGESGFYEGEVAQAIVDGLAEYDGVMTMEDLKNYEVTVSEPVQGEYKGYQIISSPPPSSGGAHLIEILNIFENFDIGSMEINSTEYVHLLAETFKLAFADRAEYMADENFTQVPIGGITSQEYADIRAEEIDMTAAMEEADYDDPTIFEHEDTTHYSVADSQGNMVSVTKTINYYFGSGVMIDGYGFMMNNEMDDFSTDPDSVNVIEPGKKPLSSMSPSIILNEDGTPFMILGTPGGARIFSAVAQVFSRVIDHEMDLADAIAVPKISNNGAKSNIQYEEAMKGYEEYELTEETLEELVEMGHNEPSTYSSGAIQAIQFLDDGTIYGTADPRQDGKAVGY